MPTEGVGGLVVRFYEALHNDHDLTMFDTAVDPKVVCRWSGLPELHGPDELRAAVAADLEGFPDQAISLEQIIVDGGDVASRWTYRGTHTGDYYGIPPTGRAVVSTFVGGVSLRPSAPANRESGDCRRCSRPDEGEPRLPPNRGARGDRAGPLRAASGRAPCP